jgi:predicted nucleotidyltransferase/beta-phosphoglucomutase-like phosphatase (HAD superfamily)
MFFAKDFIETTEGLIFAVVEQGLEDGKVLCFLRYVRGSSGWKKLATEQANQLLQQQYPDYLHYSTVLDAHLHAVAVERVARHHQPKHRLQQLMQASRHDIARNGVYAASQPGAGAAAVEQDLQRLCRLFEQHGLDLAQIGITGSLLIGVQNLKSDIDLVCYGRDVFHQCRAITRRLIEQGHLQALNDQDWQQSYERRSCDLSLDEYVWHERRKCNKAVINGRKFDLNFIDHGASPEPIAYQKCEPITLQCKVIDDVYAFDYPAEFKIDHHQISSVVSFTATYTGQAIAGEIIEVSGVLEQSEHGVKRIVVGSSREAHGEYIKVIRYGRMGRAKRLVKHVVKPIALALDNDGFRPILRADFDAVIFDMDGLVLDTESTYIIAWQQAAKEMGYDFSDDFCLSLSGCHYKDVELRLAEHCGAEFNLETFNRLSGDRWREYVDVHGIKLKHGFTGLVELLIRKKIPYCLATNSPGENALECLQLAGIEELFPIVVAREQVRHGKPEPDIFLKAAELMQVDIGRCLVIEDSFAGIVAASRAGAVTVLVPSTAQIDPQAIELCDLMVNDLEQLANMIRA